jgi:PAS domain S-box-containing protein
MKRVLIIEDHGQEMGKALDLLIEQGFDVTLCADCDGNLRNGGGWPQGPFADIIHNAPIGIFRSTLDGRFICVNPALAGILKYGSPEELMETVNRKSIAEVLYPEPGQRREVVADILSHEGWQVFEVEYRCKDGSFVTCKDYIRRVPGNEGREFELEGFVEDITARRQAEDALRVSQFIIDKTSIGIFRGSSDARIIMANEFGAKMLDYTREELCSMNFFDIDPSLTEESWREHRKKLTTTGYNTFESLNLRKDGTIFPVEVTINYHRYGEQEFSCSFVKDITKHKKAEEALRNSEEKYRVVADFTYDWETWLDPEGEFIYVSPSCERITGYSACEFLNDQGLLKKVVHPDDSQAVIKHLRQVLKKDTSVQQIDFRIITKDGKERWIEHICQPVFSSDGKWLGRRASNRDSTDRKRAEEKVSAALAEKVLLLKEVHHRVKNNMQIITSLLDFQAESINDKETVNAFRESQDRIKAMALIHERLYESADIAFIDFQRYIEELSAHLFDSYLVEPGRITLQVDAGGVTMGIDLAIPCGLIINELVTNSLKHAFPGNRQGEIRVLFTTGDGGQISLKVADNGVGLPPGLDFTKTPTLGLQLVNMLTRQLRGVARVESEDVGASIVIEFSGSQQLASL